ncbi:HU family DNA-binding protein [Magnetococcales bacterium HHB-1]
MRKPDLINSISENAQISKKQAGSIVDVFLSNIGSTLAQGEKVELYGFGSFQVVQREARNGRNPRTGEPMVIPASRNVRFRPAKALRDQLN